MRIRLVRVAGFSLPELIVVIGVIGALSALSIPVYLTYQTHNDLHIATQQVIQGLSRARLLSQSGQGDKPWGFYVPSGMLYTGTGYAYRDTQFDERFPMPSSIMLSGPVMDFTFSRGEGQPSELGSLTLRALDGFRRLVQVEVEVGAQDVGIADTTQFVICHDPNGTRQSTLVTPQQWESDHQQAHPALNDTLGSCDGYTDGGQPDTTPPPSSTPVTFCHAKGWYDQAEQTLSRAEFAAHQIHGDAAGSCPLAPTPVCTSLFVLNPTTRTVEVKQNVTMRVAPLASSLTYGGLGTPYIPVRASYAQDNGAWQDIFNANIVNTATHVLAGAVETSITPPLPTTSFVNFQVTAQYAQPGFFTYGETRTMSDTDAQMLVLREGDPLPSYLSTAARLRLVAALTPGGYLAGSAGSETVHIPANGSYADTCGVIILTEANPLSLPAAREEDYTDAVLLVQFKS